VTAFPTDDSPRPRRWIVLLPLALFLVLAALFFYRLGAGDPAIIPSALIGRPAPDADLPPVAGLMRDGKPLPGLSAADFKGRVTVLNVWGSWCLPCREEAPVLMRMAADSRYRLVGLNYKDEANNALKFLERFGNPFVAIGADANGRGAIEWGVYGVPETFVIDRAGMIVYKLVGPVTPANLPSLRLAIEKTLAAKS
jgi:cytochrome c biogenesis protein CcmG/thiol:disulfide interchange protein DsbE